MAPSSGVLMPALTSWGLCARLGLVVCVIQLANVGADLAARHASTVVAGWGGVSSHCEMSVSLR